MKTSCIQHRKGEPLLMVRLDYWTICGEDHAAAGLLAIFEYWHNINLGKVEQQEDRSCWDPDRIADQELWTYRTIAKLQADLIFLYGERKIREAIAALVTKGYLKVEGSEKNPFNRTQRFLLLTENVQESLRAFERTLDAAERRSPDGEKEVSQTSERRSLSIRDHIETTEEEIPSVGFPEKIQEANLKTICSRWNLAKGTKRLNKADKYALFEMLERVHPDEDEVLEAIHRFTEDEYWREQGLPFRAFLKVWRKYALADSRHTQPAAPSAPREDIPSPPAVTHAEPAPNGSSGQPAVLVAIWNKHVPQAVIDWNPEVHAEAEMRLLVLSKDSLFRENFEKLCQRAGKIHAGAGEDVGWLDLHWLIRRPKAGEVQNWKRLLAGEFDWMAKKTKKKSDFESPSELVRRTAENIRKRAQNAEHA